MHDLSQISAKWSLLSDPIIICSNADIDECAVNRGGCAQDCSNNDGSFLCLCDVGYFLNGTDKVSCHGIIYFTVTIVSLVTCGPYTFHTKIRI